MTILTVRPNADSAIGWTRRESATYATALSGGGTGSANPSATSLAGGDQLSGGIYYLSQTQMRFSLASLPVGATVTDVTIEWTTTTFNVSGGGGQNILGFSGGTVGTGTFVNQTSALALTSYGNFTTGYHTGDTTYQLSLNAAARAAAAANAGGNFDCMWASDRFLAGTAPTSNQQYYMYSDDDGTAARRPALIITYTTGTNWTQDVNDAATAGDTQINDVAQALADTQAVADAQINDVTLSSIDDSAATADAWANDVTPGTLADTVIVDDAWANDVAQALADAPTATDDPLVNDYGQALADTQAAADSLGNAVDQVLADTAAGDDALTVAYALAAADTVTIDDLLDRLLTANLALADIATIGDNQERSWLSTADIVANLSPDAVAFADTCTSVSIEWEFQTICVIAELDE